MPYYDYSNNEDAGDLSAMGYADYCGEMAEQADAERESSYVEAFDADTQPGYYAIRVMSYGHQADLDLGRLAGPSDCPYCEGCEKRLSRSEPEGIYYGRDAVFFCGEDCRDSHVYGGSDYSEGREFPTYG